MNFIFAFDMLRNFLQPFVNEQEKYITVPKVIGWRYLKTWFGWDLFAFFPLALIRANSEHSEGGYNNVQNFMKLNFERLPRFY
mmetsp:Transcript_31638/g.48393  ORF Transcript_31638/g.48393 Transcript_31638/m.48393 type:complete len:83 (-) Transcript_31638:2662-2910(-)